MEPLREMFNASYYEKLATEMQKVKRDFPAKEFVTKAVRGIGPLSLNERLRLTTELVHAHLQLDLQPAIAVLKEVVTQMPHGYQNIFFCDYLALYGLNDPDLSLKALKYFTRFGSAEFAIRLFLRKDLSKTLKVMRSWANDPDHHVRRLASEGSRPRLPWSFKLDAVIEDPSLTREILYTLRADPELYVRKSVANHLNDISKDHPGYMLELISGWDLQNPHTGWIVRHASRSLIKKGHPGSLSVFDFEKNARVSINRIRLPASVRLGDALSFGFDLISEKDKAQKLVVDYIIHYRKGSGRLSPKVFKLKELVLEPRTKATISKKQVFKNFTTRKHFAGEHFLEIQVNGKVVARKSFDLQV